MSRSRTRRRRRIGRVSVYQHRSRWWIYYREHGRPVRRAVADDPHTAEQVAAQVNLELPAAAPTLFSFRPISVAHLQRAFIDYHEHVARSSLATVSRYRAPTQHLVDFVAAAPNCPAAHDVEVEAFVRYLRTIRITSNGHRTTAIARCATMVCGTSWKPADRCTLVPPSAGTCRPALTTHCLGQYPDATVRNGVKTWVENALN